MTVCFTPYVRGASSDAWVLPHIERPDQEEFEVDVCNANAVDLLLALGLEPASYGDVIAIDMFSNLVTAATRRHLGKRSPELPTIEGRRPRRDSGISEPLRRLRLLLTHFRLLLKVWHTAHQEGAGK
jgi:hypothetical protein